MMSIGASEYGGALYALAKDESLQDKIFEDLKLICALFEENKEYMRLLQNPSLEKQERLSLIDKAFKESVQAHTLNFCKILCEKSALNILPDCKKVYTSLLYDDKGIMPVTAISAVALTKEQQKALSEKLKTITGKTPELTLQTDETLIGGIKLIYADKEIDGSAIKRLEQVGTLISS